MEGTFSSLSRLNPLPNLPFSLCVGLYQCLWLCACVLLCLSVNVCVCLFTVCLPLSKDMGDMSMPLHGSSSERETSTILDVDGFTYFVVDRDLSKGDRRCDGKFLSNFFTVVDTQDEAMTNVRQSKRVVKKRDLSHTLCLDTPEDPELNNVDVGRPINVRTVLTAFKKRHCAKDIIKNAICIIEDPLSTAIVAEEEVSCDTNVSYPTNEVVDDFDLLELDED